MTARDAKIVGAWEAGGDTLRGSTGLLVVYFTELGTAHAGDLRKRWRVPDEVILPALPASTTVELEPELIYSSAAIDEWRAATRIHPLLLVDDERLAEAFERLVKEPSFAKINLSDWEFKLAADAPSVFLRYGGFTWKQRKYLREIAKKVLI